MSRRDNFNPVAKQVNFDNSTNGFNSENVQDAIEEVQSIASPSFFPQFQRIGTLNSDLYLHSWADQMSGLLSSARPSGDASNGYRYGNSAPIACPFNGKVIKATFVIQGAAVSTGSPGANPTVNGELWNVGFTNQGSKIGDMHINIPNASYTIGQWWNASVDTNFTGSIDLDLDVTAGQLLGVKFNSTTGNNEIVAVDNITVILEIKRT